MHTPHLVPPESAPLPQATETKFFQSFGAISFVLFTKRQSQ